MAKTFNWIIILAIIVVALNLVSPAGAKNVFAIENSVVSIQIKQKIQVKDENIYLRDIALINADEKLKESIGKILLCILPNPGSEKRLSDSLISSKFKANKTIPKNAQLVIPKSVQIIRDFQTVPVETLEKLFSDYFTSRLKGTDCKISDIRVCQGKKFPAGKLSLNINDYKGENLSGRINLSISVNVDGKNFGKINMAGKIERQTLIKKGDQVKLVAKNSKMSITTIGVAKGNGAKSDMLRVENISSGKTVSGRVLDSSTVEVLF